MKSKLIAIAALFVLVFGGSVHADDENYEINWFLLMNYAGRINDLSPGFGDGGDWLLGEERLRMDVVAWADSIPAEVTIKMDFYHDAIADDVDIDLREAYLDYTTGPWDIRLGRQIITWGVGDLVFINDVWPKNWVSFFSGRPLGYLKSGVDGARVRFTGDGFGAEFIFLPTFEPDNLPGSDRFSYFDPLIGIQNRTTVEPESTFEDSEVAGRIYTRMAGFDVSGYYYKGYWHEPAMMPDNPMMPTALTFHYPRLNVYGASAQGTVPFGGILSLEFGYYDSEDDRDGIDPMIKNSEVRYLVGYSRAFPDDLTIGVQYFRKEFLDYDNYLATLPMGFPTSEDYRDEVTLSIRKQLMQQKLTIYVFGYYSLVDEDYYVLPSVEYKYSDELALTVGGNFWGGESDTTFLGQFDENDNIYMSVRFDF
jgi:hypothetical protein